MSTDVPQAHSIQLQEQGWTRRFTAMGRRLNEAVELYCQLGFEILLEQMDLTDLAEENTSGAEGCEYCIVTTLVRTIYTRPRKIIGEGRDESRPYN